MTALSEFRTAASDAARWELEFALASDSPEPRALSELMAHRTARRIAQTLEGEPT